MSADLVPVGATNNLGVIDSKMNPLFRKNQSVKRPMNSAGGRHLAIQYPGLLPTLGLNKYKHSELKNNNEKNPFSVQKETEKLLVARERERERKDYNKNEKD